MLFLDIEMQAMSGMELAAKITGEQSLCADCVYHRIHGVTLRGL